MYKKIALASALICASNIAFAGTTGWYVGLQAGYADTNYSAADVSNFVKNPNNVSGTSTQKNDNSGAVGRLYLGYQFNNYIAAEAGYTYFEPYSYSNVYGLYKADADVTQQSGDILLKPMLPLSKQFDLFALLGADYVHASSQLNHTAKTYALGYKTQSAFRPEYGLGAEFYFKQYWSVDLTWREFTKGGSSSSTSSSGNHIEQTQQTMIGIAYHFHNPDDDNF